MSPPTVRSGLGVSIRLGVAYIALERPERHNALTVELLEELGCQLASLADNPQVSCLVLSGRGASFCSGMDLEGLPSDPATLATCADVIDTLEAFPRPTIAQVQGHCLTGGLELALACDIIVAGEGARLGDTHGRWGLVPTFGMSVRLTERVGAARAKELMFTSRVLDAETARSVGLVDHVVPDAVLDTTVTSLAAEIARNNAGTNSIVKSMIADHRQTDRGEALRRVRSLHYGIPAAPPTRTRDT